MVFLFVGHQLVILVKVTNLLSVGAALCRDHNVIAPKRRSYREAAGAAK